MWNDAGLLDAMMDVVDALSNITLAGKPLFKWVDIWNNQLKFEKDGTGYSLPASGPSAFVEFKQLDTIRLGQGIDLTNYEIIFHIIDRQENNAKQLDRNIKVFGLRNLVKQKFQLYQPKQMGRMGFLKDEQDFTHDNVYHYKISFKAALVDTWGNILPTQGTASVHVVYGYSHSNVEAGVSFDIIGDTLIVYPDVILNITIQP